MPHPLRYTLFPYTTLFRSHVHLNVKDIEVQTKFWSEYFGAVPLKRDGLHGEGTGNAHPLQTAGGEDRKSTRLNSSHRCISYAVFCLKKKRPTPDRPGTCHS